MKTPKRIALCLILAALVLLAGASTQQVAAKPEPEPVAQSCESQAETEGAIAVNILRDAGETDPDILACAYRSAQLNHLYANCPNSPMIQILIDLGTCG